MKIHYSFAFVVAMSVCSAQAFKAVIDFEESTQIVRELLVGNKLGDLLQASDPQQIDILINNFSPAQFAFEIEVVNIPAQLAVVYFCNDLAQDSEFLKKLDHMAVTYGDRVKFVLIDANKFFSLANSAQIEAYPTILIFKERAAVERIEQSKDLGALKKKIDLHVQ